MSEIITIGAVLLVAAGLLIPVALRAEPVLARVERGLTWLSTALILFVMGFVCLEVVMRYVFNAPIPGHLEGSELLMPMIVFLALAYTQSVNSHVGMTLVVDALGEESRRRLEIVTLLLSMLIYGVLTYYSGAQAYRAWIYDDVTMTPPYFKVWPSALAVPVGFAVCAVRMYFQLLQRISPTRFPFEVRQVADGHGE